MAYELPPEPRVEVAATVDGDIEIIMTDGAGNESTVFISVERAPRLIEFIQAVRDEIVTARADAAAARDARDRP